ncbi:MAG: ribosome silencing factor [Chloroflexi bacterium]|nr:ribosome silencing factor [Chloroflexota bacterium]
MTSTTHPIEESDPVEFLKSEDIARLALDIASDRLGSDIALLDISEVSDFTDFFVIVTGETSRHLEAIGDDVTRSLRKKKIRPLHREGTGPGGWILVDYGDVVLHIFDSETRERYALERLWSRGREIVRVQ